MGQSGRTAGASATGRASEQTPRLLAAIEAELLARAPESSIEPSLDRVQALLARLGDPQLTFSSVHLAGTNGKTSTTRMVDALLRAHDLRSGCYTSPHLESMTERIVIDGDPLPDEAFVSAFDDIALALQDVESDGGRRLTFFELLTALAFVAFADAPVSTAAVEVGLGGTWDATNLLAAPVSVVLPVGLDHMEYLGDSIDQIAAEKAGIVQPGQLVVVAEQTSDATAVVRARARDVGAAVVQESVDFGLVDRQVAVGGQVLALQGLAARYEDVFLPLHGVHQAHNAACAVAAVEAFLGGGRRALGADVVATAFANVRSPGRLEVVRVSPTVIVDAAHNPAGAQTLAATIHEAFGFDRLVGVLGVLADKDAEGILQALEPLMDSVVVTRSSSPRALDPEELGAIATEVFGADRVQVEPVLARAVERAVADAESGPSLAGSAVLVTGSVTVAGEARALMRG